MGQLAWRRLLAILNNTIFKNNLKTGSRIFQIRPGLNANEIHVPYDKHHKVSSLAKRHQNTHNSVKYEVI